jgi:hypothetical protein
VPRPSPAAAIALTAVALAAINFALADLIVRAAGFQILGPPIPLALAILLVGVLAAAAAVAQWRHYLRRN